MVLPTLVGLAEDLGQLEGHQETDDGPRRVEFAVERRELRRDQAGVVVVVVRLLPLPHRITSAYPPNAKRPRLRTMVKPTLSKMLSTSQNRQPLPIGRGLPRGSHLHHEHHVFHERF